MSLTHRNTQSMDQTDSWRPMLQAVPHQNRAAPVEDQGSAGVVVRVKARKPWFWVPPLSWVVPSRREQVIVLDALGSQLWRFCNGEQTVEALIDAFATQHRLTFHEARVAVTGYLKLLLQRGIVVMVMPEVDE